MIILPLNVPSSNNRIYPEAEMQKAIEKLAGQKLAGTVGYVEHAPSVFMADNFRIVHDSVLADITFSTPEIAKLIESGDCVIRPAGFGQLDEKGNVSDFTLTSLAIIPKDQDAFKEIVAASGSGQSTH